MHFKLQKKKRISVNKIMCFLVILFLIVLGILYCDQNDYYVYGREYNLIRSGGHRKQTWEVGYDFLCLIFIKLGVGFELFYDIYIVMVILLLQRFFKIFSKNYLYSLILFTIFPYINYLQQMRSTLTIVIVLNLLEYLINSSERKRIKALKFICVIILLCTIHASNIAYLVFLLPLFMNKKVLKKLVITLYLAIPVLIKVFFPIVMTFLGKFEVFSRLVNGMNIEIRFSRYTIFNLLVYGMLLCIFLYLDYMEDIGKDNKRLEELYKVSLIVILLIILCCFSESAYRIPALALPIIYITIELMCENLRYGINKIIAKNSAIIFVLAIFMVYWGPLNERMFDRLMNEMWRTSL